MAKVDARAQSKVLEAPPAPAWPKPQTSRYEVKADEAGGYDSYDSDGNVRKNVREIRCVARQSFDDVDDEPRSKHRRKGRKRSSLGSEKKKHMSNIIFITVLDS